MGHRFVCERCGYTETAHGLGYDGACEAYVSPAPDAEQRLWALVEAEHRQWIQEGGPQPPAPTRASRASSAPSVR